MRGTIVSVLVAGAMALTFVAAREHARAEDVETGSAPTQVAPMEPVPTQASCGDQRCSPPEDCNTCPQDCGSCYGDRRCAPPEDCNSCPQDCGHC